MYEIHCVHHVPAMINIGLNDSQKMPFPISGENKQKCRKKDDVKSKSLFMKCPEVLMLAALTSSKGNKYKQKKVKNEQRETGQTQKSMREKK